MTSFDPHALTRLATCVERDRFNLPERIDDPRAVSVPRTVFLPLYVVRGVRSDGRACCLSSSQASDTADDDLAPFVEASPLPGLLDGELEDGRTGPDETRARAWLGGRGLTSVRPHQTGHGTLQVSLPPEAFDGDGRVPLAKVGSYVLLGSGFLRIWCASEDVRHRALLERIGASLAYRAQPVAADVQAQVGRFARQLDLGTIDLATLSQMATDADHRSLAAQLARLARNDSLTS